MKRAAASKSKKAASAAVLNMFESMRVLLCRFRHRTIRVCSLCKLLAHFVDHPRDRVFEVGGNYFVPALVGERFFQGVTLRLARCRFRDNICGEERFAEMKLHFAEAD